jgi:hypothetical protein
MKEKLKPKKNQKTAKPMQIFFWEKTLQRLKRKLSFPNQSSITKWQIKEKKRKVFLKHYLFNYRMI